MTPQEIPQQLVDILDERAGKKHSREGRVLATLAEILTKYDEIRKNPPPQTPAVGTYAQMVESMNIDSPLPRYLAILQ